MMVKAERASEITPSQAAGLLLDDNWGVQEKYNGTRQIIAKTQGRIYSYNREGEPSNPLPSPVVQALLKLPEQEFVIDVEKVYNKIYVFDVLVYRATPIVDKQYSYRELCIHKLFDGSNNAIVPVYTAKNRKHKEALLKHLAETNSEGAIFRNLHAPYTQGESPNIKKLKFWKTLDCVVIGPSPEGHDSVEIGVYDNGRLHRVSGCALRNFRVSKGDIVEVRYLYSSDTGHIVQPTMLRVRTDKAAEGCTIDQLQMNKNFKVKAQ